MRIGFDMSSIHRSRWSDYAVRFVCGGIVTVLTGLIAKRYGPSVAGLFLAFPAIFPAGATLIEKHEQQKKEGCWTRRDWPRQGRCKRRRGGGSLGSLGPGGLRNTGLDLLTSSL